MRKIKRLCDKIFTDRKIRFLFVGVLNTIFGYLVYALFIHLGMHYLLAQFFGSILAVAHSYLWNKYFTFKSPEKSWAEVMRFIFVYAVSYVLNMALLYIMIDVYKLSAYLAGAIGLFVTTLISYFGHKKISFGRTLTDDRG